MGRCRRSTSRPAAIGTSSPRILAGSPTGSAADDGTRAPAISRDPQRQLVCFGLGKARLQDLFALVAEMRTQDVRETGAVAALERVQDRLVLLHGERPALRRH